MSTRNNDSLVVVLVRSYAMYPMWWQFILESIFISFSFYIVIMSIIFLWNLPLLFRASHSSIVLLFECVVFSMFVSAIAVQIKHFRILLSNLYVHVWAGERVRGDRGINNFSESYWNRMQKQHVSHIAPHTSFCTYIYCMMKNTHIRAMSYAKDCSTI